MKGFVFVIFFGLAFMASADQVQKSPIRLPVLHRYMLDSLRKARVLYLREPGFNPCVLPTTMIKVGNESVGDLKGTNIYGLSNYRVRGLRLRLHDSKLDAMIKVTMTQRGAGKIEINTKDQIHAGKAMYYTPKVLVTMASSIAVNDEAVQLQDLKITSVRGRPLIDPLLDLPLKRALLTAIFRSYSKAAKTCIQKIMQPFLTSVNKVLASRSTPQILQGLRPLLPEVNQTQLITDAILFTRKAITDAKDLEPLPLPLLPVSFRRLTGNVSGQLLQLTNPTASKFFYANVDSVNPAKVNVFVRYNVLPLSFLLEPRGFRFNIKAKNIYLHFEVLQTPQAKQIIKITNFYLGSINVKSPRRIPRKLAPVIRSTIEATHKFLTERLEVLMLLKLQ